jgi:small subunit ribosomal protein S4
MRNLRKKFKRPKKSWNIEFMEDQNAVKSEYGLLTTKELLLSREKLRGFRQRARQLIAVANEAEKKILLGKIVKLGMLKEGSGLDDVLALDVKSILERRLQTILFKKGMATSINHARQLIVHGRVSINGVRIKFPSYIVTVEEEPKIGWYRGEPKKSEGPKRKGHVKEEAVESDVEEGVEAAETEAIEGGTEEKEAEEDAEESAE